MKRTLLPRNWRMATLTLALVGCDGAPEPGAPNKDIPGPTDPLAEALENAPAKVFSPSEADGITTVRQPLVFDRSDFVQENTVGTGFWGIWGQRNFCNPGTFAKGIRIRKEIYQSGGDDTSLNRVTLKCVDEWGGGYNEVSDGQGIWGPEFDWGECPTFSYDTFLFALKMKIEPVQGSGDNTTANDVAGACDRDGTVGGSLAHSGWASFGNWTTWSICPAETVICGLRSRFEQSRGTSVDDTALNGLRVMCCQRPAEVFQAPMRQLAPAQMQPQP